MIPDARTFLKEENKARDFLALLHSVTIAFSSSFQCHECGLLFSYMKVDTPLLEYCCFPCICKNGSGKRLMAATNSMFVGPRFRISGSAFSQSLQEIRLQDIKNNGFSDIFLLSDVVTIALEDLGGARPLLCPAQNFFISCSFQEKLAKYRFAPQGVGASYGKSWICH